jgi:Gas vesicle synthesis protein GvpL/GvpF
MDETKVPDGQADSSRAYYVYCVAESTAAKQFSADSLPEAIEADAALEWVSANSLSALFSRVPLTSYDEVGLARNLSDATWTAVRAMRHEQVVEYFAKRTSVVPLRFGTIYLEPAGIERMLVERANELRTIIERLRDRVEWGVNVYFDRLILLDSITTISPRLRELAEEAARASPGQSYLIQKKIDALKVDEARAEIVRLTDEIERTLREASQEARRLRVLKVEATEYGELKAKFAFLIDRTAFDEFRAAAERLAQDNQASGVRLELTGPWPAYNFATEATIEHR